MSNAINSEDANSRLEPFGYQCRADPGGGYYVTRLTGSHFSRFLQDDADLNSFIELLEHSDIWELDETNVDANKRAPINMIKSVERPQPGNWYKLPPSLGD